MNNNKAKIIATYGPAIQSKEALKEVIIAGVDVVRFNFSHGDYKFHKKGFEIIKELNKELKTNTAILADMQGPKIRIGEIEGEIFLDEGKMISITDKESLSTKEELFVSYDKLYEEVKPNDRILINDGNIELKVIYTNNNKIQAKIIYGGILTSKKGVNLPDTDLQTPTLTEKDKIDLDFAIENEANWIALSFVRKASDIEKIISIIGKEKHSFMKVISKIEKPEALRNIDSIIETTDAIMIARGDLGVEIPAERVPLWQKKIIKKCIANAKPVIVATQMMESMINNPIATRAEINDVANAVLDGADAVMLSGETSIGKHPLKVVEKMQQILKNIEKSNIIYDKKYTIGKNVKVEDAICYTACKVSKELKAKAIVGMTRSGYTAFRISSHRPKANIFIFTENEKLLPTLSLFWGIQAFRYDEFIGTNETIDDVIEILKKNNLVSIGDRVVNTASMPLKKYGKTNALKVSII